MGFFDSTSSGEMATSEVNELQKALVAGYGTDSAQFTGGRALIPENLESEVVNVVSQLKEDCKVMNTVKKTPVKSTVHELNLRTGHGDYRFLTVREGGQSLETDQSLERKPFNMKYMQTRRSVTKQMEVSETFEGALASEKIAGVETIVKSAEYQCFHGDSAIVPTEFDGFIASINRAKAEDQNIISLRGKSIGSVGEVLFDNIAQMVFEKGGSLETALFPPVLAKDIKGLFKDRIRFTVMDSQASMQALPSYPTAIGSTIKFTGEGAGADKFYHVKGIVRAAGDPLKRPAAPATVTGAASGTGSLFETGDAGDYRYTVHAVNSYGISAGTAVSAAVVVGAGNKVTLTITPGAGVQATGFIICRSKKDGTEVMEMDSVANSGAATTIYVDENKELPGTASMLFLTEKRIQPVYTFAQLLPVCTYPLAPINTAETPFLVMLFGALELRAPKFCGLVKNIAYTGGLY
ncbi:hypothetical protein [Treponema sp.]|uniref:hypothetical protein n=1 Tax=Treponema sp. TaxID=166 RepID=UPI003FA1EA32